MEGVVAVAVVVVVDVVVVVVVDFAVVVVAAGPAGLVVVDLLLDPSRAGSRPLHPLRWAMEAE